MKQTTFSIRWSKIIALCITCNITTPIHSTQIARGDSATEPHGFSVGVNTKAFHRKSGTLFVGLTNGASTYAVSKALRPICPNPPRFVSLIQSDDTIVNNKSVLHLSIAESETTTPLTLAFVAADTNTTDTPKVTAISDDGSVTPQESENPLKLNDASDATSVVNLTTDDSTIFALLKDGTTVKGLAQVTIKKDSNGRLSSLTTRDATTGAVGNLSRLFDGTITEIKGAGGAATLPADSTIQNAMYWDPKLERAYIGFRVDTAAPAGSIAKAVVITREDTGITLQSIVSNDAAISALGTGAEIVVARSTGGAVALGVQHIGVMHASTGPSYLIVNAGPDADRFKQVFALPLVDNPADTTIHGTLADKNGALDSGKFTDAAGAGELALITDDAAEVGASNLPIDAGETPRDMVVAGDTVYVAITSTTNPKSNGVFYSQALFAQDGRIKRWSPWTKRAVPFNAFPTITTASSAPEHDGSIRLVEPDLKTGNIWVVEGSSGQLVGLTTWTRGIRSDNLPAVLNTLLTTGTYSVLNLDQETPGFSTFNFAGVAPTANRFALFGGIDTVVFTRTSRATPVGDFDAKQDVIIDFTDPENILETTLETGAGCVQTLEYARANNAVVTDLNYFFAGTPNGLYVFGDNDGDDSFTANDLDANLNAGLFTTGGWKKISAISGSVVDIKSSGLALYILVNQLTGITSRPLRSTLYKAQFQNTSDVMFNATNLHIIARSDEEPFDTTFPRVQQFYGIQPISTGESDEPQLEDQLILATNQGLYKSRAPQDANRGLSDPAIQDATAALWTLIDEINRTMFPDIAGLSTPIRCTVWPFSQANIVGCTTFDRGKIFQISGTGFFPDTDGGHSAGDTIDDAIDADPTMPNRISDKFIPGPFNSREDLTCLRTFDPITFYHSDGARRFFIFNRHVTPSSGSKIGIVPFCSSEWDLIQQTVIKHPVLDQVKRFYWIEQIGATGFLLAGTNDGVVALE